MYLLRSYIFKSEYNSHQYIHQPSMRLTHDMLDQTKIDQSESINLILTSNWLLCSNSIYRIDARSTTKTHLPFHSGKPELL